MIATVSIARSALDAIVAHAREALPRECCGLLIGTPDRIVRAWRAANVAAAATRFQIDPRDHFAAIRAARAAGLDVVGAYHSHPSGPARPSETDRRESLDPSLVHVIAAGTNDIDVRAFYLETGNFREVALVPVP